MLLRPAMGPHSSIREFITLIRTKGRALAIETQAEEEVGAGFRWHGLTLRHLDRHAEGVSQTRRSANDGIRGHLAHWLDPDARAAA